MYQVRGVGFSEVLSQDSIMLAFREFPEDRWKVATEEKEISDEDLE